MSEFWDDKKALKYLFEEAEYSSQVVGINTCLLSLSLTRMHYLEIFIRWCLLVCVETHACISIPVPDSGLGLSPVEGYELALSAFGACIWTLRRSLIDNDIIQMQQFEVS